MIEPWTEPEVGSSHSSNSVGNSESAFYLPAFNEMDWEGEGVEITDSLIVSNEYVAV